MTAKKQIAVLMITAFMVWYYFCLPNNLFRVPYSKVVYASDGSLLNAQTATDGQWRFPESKEIDKKFETALLTYEDGRFYHHPGVDLIGIGRALIQNIKAGNIVSGGSTITMQLMRMSRGMKPRTLRQKILEVIWATRAEIRYSKKEILAFYAGHAPFGGNVVGLEAAAWRYFGKKSEDLTWAEAAMLAVLPNAPSLIHPGKNRKELLEKRNRLLGRLLSNESIDSLTYATSLLEEIPSKPKPLPNHAFHLAMRTEVEGMERMAINGTLQKEGKAIVENHHRRYKRKGIHNAAVIVVDNHTGLPYIYVGNTDGYDHEKMVDMVIAPRSSGSILKPLLYGLAIEEGIITPEELLADYPLNIKGFNPKNYDKEYSGAVSASEALTKSLNVPMVSLLRKYGVDKFHRQLQNFGLTTLHRTADEYGLSLILGGAEVNLEELVKVYSELAIVLNSYGQAGEKDKRKKSPINAGTIYWVFEAMKEVIRPNEDGFWQSFNSSQPIAWKTGTSYGHRDAWAIGISKDFTVGVWVGNADGEGHPEIVGSTAAGSLMFDIWNILPGQNGWFRIPHDDLREYTICKQSGQLATKFCTGTEEKLYPKGSKWTRPCHYHQQVFLDSTRSYQTYLDCENNIIDTCWFVLPPAMAYYYKREHPEYSPLPSRANSCDKEVEKETINLLFPSEGEVIYMPNGMNGEKMKLIAKAVHLEENAEIYWHLEGQYMGLTRDFHQYAYTLYPGEYTIMVMDNEGRKKQVNIKIEGRRENDFSD